MIVQQIPTDVNHFALRQQRMESVLAGYRLQTAPITRSYIDGLIVRAQKVILNNDTFCQVSIVIGFLYVYVYLPVQAVRFWMGVKP